LFKIEKTESTSRFDLTKRIDLRAANKKSIGKINFGGFDSFRTLRLIFMMRVMELPFYDKVWAKFQENEKLAKSVWGK
jgi:hypothetical protein